jgi:glycosyltransferase involved in cell wall biosynthesis
MISEIVAFPFVLLLIYPPLLALTVARRRSTRASAPGGKSVGYLFLPFCFQEGRISGGAAAHMRGVVSGLIGLGWNVHVLSSQRGEEFPSGVKYVEAVVPWQWGEHIPNLPVVLYNGRVFLAGMRIFRKQAPDLIYQRHLLFNISGLLLARALGRPLILEYNCSEVWMVEHWGKRWTFLMHLARWMEHLAIHSADLIIVVSERVREELLTRGVPAERISVNFNAVDAEMFRPDADGGTIRERYGIPRKAVVAGFIGTFSPWHGVEVLAEAVRPTVATFPDLHFLLIGDGPLLTGVKERVAREGCGKFVTFAGSVSAEQSPAYLSSCDILLSPHVQNPDGSPFFGSPTKLFEYMAMGKAIVASEIEQLAQVLRHERTALLVPPGRSQALIDAIVRLARDPTLRERLGRAARLEAVAHHTWKERVERIIDAAEGRSPRSITPPSASLEASRSSLPS